MSKEKPAGVNRPPSLQPQISGRLLAAVADDVVADLRAVWQTIIAGLLNRRDMDEHVLAAGVRLNEAITFLAVEPLHCPARHLPLPRNNDCSNRTAIGVPRQHKPPGPNPPALPPTTI